MLISVPRTALLLAQTCGLFNTEPPAHVVVTNSSKEKHWMYLCIMLLPNENVSVTHSIDRNTPTRINAVRMKARVTGEMSIVSELPAANTCHRLIGSISHRWIKFPFLHSLFYLE